MTPKKKQFKTLGTCQFCGEPIREFPFGWGCTSKECGTVIFKDDKFFFQVLHRPITKAKAVTLLTGGKVRLNRVDIHGVKHDMEIGLSFDRSGTYKNRYTMNYLDYDRKKDPNFNKKLDSGQSEALTAFDILNGD